MRVFRLVRAQYRPALLSGQGGLIADGRWHTAGRPIIYTASCEALAILEVRVHVRRSLPDVEFEMHEIEVPDPTIAELATADLPDNWNRLPPQSASQTIGDRWLAAAPSLALRVPSIHSRSDANLLLNPAHRSASRLVRLDSRRYVFDPRLFNS